MTRTVRSRPTFLVAAISVVVCLVGGNLAAAASDVDIGLSGRITLYTSVTQDTVDAVLAVLAEQYPDLAVDVFRAPTGELAARIAAEERSGGLSADVLWLSDPLSVQRYAADGLLAPIDPATLEMVPPRYRGTTFVGTRLLNLIIVTAPDLQASPESWSELAEITGDGAVSLPDPGFAGTAFAALGYFADAPGLGLDFYRRLKDNGAVQVSSPVEVMTGVAEGRYSAGITLDQIARAAAEKGSPLGLVWPSPGAIAVYSPAAVVASSDSPSLAQAFVASLVSVPAQQAIAETGWQPIRPDVAWPYASPAVDPDWSSLFGRQEELLASYREIFGD